MGEKAERIAIILVVSVSLIVSTLDLLGVLDTIPWLAGRIPAITLLLLAILSGYIALERFGKLNRIDDRIQASTETILRSLSGVQAVLLPTSEEAFDHMSARLVAAKVQIDHVALAPSITRRSPSSNRWEQVIEEVLKGNKAIYRYVVSFSDKARRQRVIRHLSDPTIQKYHVRSFERGERFPPALSFLIIDKDEVIMHYPYEPGQPETFLSVRHPDVVRLFAAYYRNLWDKAKPFVVDKAQ